MTSLDAFIKYDPLVRGDVESAYDEFIRHGRPGYYIAWSLVFDLVALLVISVTTVTPSSLVLQTIVVNGISLVAFAVPVFFTPSVARDRLLRGAVDVRRACVFVVPVAVAIAGLEFAVGSFFVAPSALDTGKLPLAVMTLSITWTLVMGLTAAPIFEEFAFQGWLQSRLGHFGAVPAAIITTVAFLLYHVPKTLIGAVRVGNLAFAAYLRSRTGSLALCMIAHFCNNVVIYGLGIAHVAIANRRVHG